MAKRAFLIGNANYMNNKDFKSLNSPNYDVRAVGETLISVGYDTHIFENLSFDDMNKEINNIEHYIRNGDQIIFYYSGHGYYQAGHNYITAIDSKLPSMNKVYAAIGELHSSVDLNSVTKLLSENRDGFNLIIADSCRTLNGYWDYKEPVNPPENLYLIYATTLDASADDGAQGEPGVLAKAICASVCCPGQTIDQFYSCIVKYIKYNRTSGSTMLPIKYQTATGPSYICNKNLYNKACMKKRIEDLIGIYRLALESQEEGDNLPEVLEKLIYLDDDTLRCLIDICTEAIESKLGFFYVLTKLEWIDSCDLFEEVFFIYNNAGQSLRFNNDGLYYYADCFAYINKNGISEEQSPLKLCYINGKAIHSLSNVIQIVGLGEAKMPKEFITPVCDITKTDKSAIIAKYIKAAVVGKKNVLILGSTKAHKEEFAGGLTTYFNPLDQVICINDAKRVWVQKGQYNSSSDIMDNIVSYSKEQIEQLKTAISNVQRVIYTIKSYRTHDQRRILENLYSLAECEQSIVLSDIRADIVENNVGELECEMLSCFLPKLIIQKAQVVIVMEEIVVVGSVVYSIFEKDDMGFRRRVKLDIDYEKLGKLNNLRQDD